MLLLILIGFTDFIGGTRSTGFLVVLLRLKRVS